MGTYDGRRIKGVFVQRAGDLALLAKEGDPAPVGVFTDFGDYVSQGRGTTAFLGDFGTSTTGIFTSAQGTLTNIVKTGDAAPVGIFDGVGVPATNGNVTAFVASYNNNNSEGLFVASGGAVTPVIVTGSTLFGGTVTGVGGSLSNPSLGIDDEGRISFVYTLSGGKDGVAIASPIPECETLALLAVAAPLLLNLGRHARHGW